MDRWTDGLPARSVDSGEAAEEAGQDTDSDPPTQRAGSKISTLSSSISVSCARREVPVDAAGAEKKKAAQVESSSLEDSPGGTRSGAPRPAVSEGGDVEMKRAASLDSSQSSDSADSSWMHDSPLSRSHSSLLSDEDD